jgi:hypothetical protein
MWLALGLTMALAAPMTAALGVSASARPTGHWSAGGPAGSLVSCFPPDNGNPRVLSFSITPQVVDTRRGAQVVTVRVRPQDTGGPGAATGVSGGELIWGRSPQVTTTDRVFGSGRMHWNGHGGLVLHIQFAPLDRSGSWFFALSLWDAAGNRVDYLPQDLTAIGMPSSLTTTTRAGSDQEKPELRSVRLNSAVVSVAAHAGVLRLRVRASDDVGVWAVHAFVWSLGTRDSRGGYLRRSAGTAKNGVWSGRIVIPRAAGSHRAHLVVEVGDYAGRWRTVRTRGLRQVGAPTGVRVVGHVDTHRPQVGQPRIQPSEPVDLRGGAQRFVVRVRIRDVGAGISRASFTFEGDDTSMEHQGYDNRMRLVSGTRHDGIWKATVILPRCEGEAGHWSGYVTAFDYGLPGDQASTRDVRVRNADIAPPFVEQVGGVRPEGPVRIRFDEDVVGVTAENTLVFQGFADEADRPTQPVPIGGAWVCANAAGAVVDCAAGPVRTAAFTPSSPFVDLEGTVHTVLLNPEGHLGLTDMTGNPCVDFSDDTVFLWNFITF